MDESSVLYGYIYEELYMSWKNTKIVVPATADAVGRRSVKRSGNEEDIDSGGDVSGGKS